MYEEKLKMKNTHVGVAVLGNPHGEEPTRINVGAGPVSAQNHRGITLIALIITIIVLIILAGVAITLAVDSDGLFSKANEAVGKWNNKVTQEEEELAKVINMIKDETDEDGEGEEPDAPTTVAVESVSFANESEAVKIGETKTLTVNITPSEATNKNVSYGSSDETVATVDSTGTVTGKGYGTTQITVTTEDGNKTASCKVYVNPYGTTTVETVVIETSAIYEEEAKERVVPIPVGYTASSVTGENTILGGLVIYEENEAVTENNHEVALTSRNQYVWIPVDDINEMIMCKSNASGSICTIEVQADESLKCTKHNSTDLCGRLYTTDETLVLSSEGRAEYYFESDIVFGESAMASQTWSAGTALAEPDILTGSTVADGVDSNLTGIGITVPGGAAEGTTVQDVFKGQLTNDFLAMAKSVAKYKGFYIARYEAGENGASKKNQKVLTAIDDVANVGGTFTEVNTENILAGNMWYGLYNTLRNNTGVDASIVNTHMVWRKYV